jgi:chromosomal replication initiator protein
MSVTHNYWPLVLENLKEKVSSSTYKAFFSRVEFVSTSNQGRKIVLAVPSAFNRNFIEKKYKQDFKNSIQAYYPSVIHVEYEIHQDQEALPIPAPSQQLLDNIEEQEKTAPINFQEVTQPTLLSSYLPKKTLNNLNPKYTFENFVVTRNNELAVNVAHSVIRQPGTLYNPVFLYGKVGLGKTHLLQAIGQKMLEERPSINIKYIPAETFANQYILAVQKRETTQFREYYRTVDLLLIDDIQFISGKEATQEAFFYTFNELHQQNKQIIITSDRPPKQQAAIEERLISRFEWGMVVDIHPPSLEDRIAIIKDKSLRFGLPLDDKQILQIASKVETNVREMEGVLNRVKAIYNLSGRTEIGQQELDKTLSGLTSAAVNLNLNVKYQNPESIILAVSRVMGVPKAEIMGKSRLQDVAMARQIAMWFMKYELNLSFPAIGKVLGGKDHSTILHGCQKIETCRINQIKVQQQIELVKQILNQ